jgi:hypothetical protein
MIGIAGTHRFSRKAMSKSIALRDKRYPKISASELVPALLVCVVTTHRRSHVANQSSELSIHDADVQPSTLSIEFNVPRFQRSRLCPIRLKLFSPLS